MENKKSEFSKALKIGSVCIAAYMANYVMRNVLTVVSVNMQNDGFTKEIIGLISSVYFMTYAVGQLINGWLGDRINAKNMVTVGLVMSGVSATAFPFLDNSYLQIFVFALNGFGLSMMRGPFMKVIADNTLPQYAQNCCVGISAAGFVGPLIAAALAAILEWCLVFFVSSVIMFASAIAVFIIFGIFEKRGFIQYHARAKDVRKQSYFKMFKLDKFVMYIFVGALVEVASASVMFWIPSYLSEQLGFSSAASGLLYSGVSFLRSCCPFLTVLIYRKICRKDTLIIMVLFMVSAVCFALMNFVGNIWVNIFVMVVALMCIACVSATLWSFYIPSLGKTGYVSSANGFLDFSGYVVASVANVIFASAVTQFGWTRLIYIWSGLMLFGVLAAIVGECYSRQHKCD